MRKNLWKKAWKIGAGVITIFLMCSTLAVALSNPNELIVDPNGPYWGTIRKPIQFSCSIKGGVSPFNITWDFGDGNFSDEQNPSHQYGECGNFTVNLTITDATNKSVTVTTTAKIDDWLILVYIGLDEEEKPPFFRGESIRFLAFIKNSDLCVDLTPPIKYKIWVERWFPKNSPPGTFPLDLGEWKFFEDLLFDESDPLAPGHQIDIHPRWFARESGLFKVCIIVTAGSVSEETCFEFIVKQMPGDRENMEINIHNTKIQKIFSEIYMLIDTIHSKLLNISKLFFH